MASAPPVHWHWGEDEESLRDVHTGAVDLEQDDSDSNEDSPAAEPNLTAADISRRRETRRETVAVDPRFASNPQRPSRISLPGRQTKPELDRRRKLGMSSRTQSTDERLNCMSQSSRRIECSVCFRSYKDTGDQVPRNLVCGHTFCTGERERERERERIFLTCHSPLHFSSLFAEVGAQLQNFLSQVFPSDHCGY